jgi:hypothetical protein
MTNSPRMEKKLGARMKVEKPQWQTSQKWNTLARIYREENLQHKGT